MWEDNVKSNQTDFCIFKYVTPFACNNINKINRIALLHIKITVNKCLINFPWATLCIIKISSWFYDPLLSLHSHTHYFATPDDGRSAAVTKCQTQFYICLCCLHFHRVFDILFIFTVIALFCSRDFCCLRVNSRLNDRSLSHFFFLFAWLHIFILFCFLLIRSLCALDNGSKYFSYFLPFRWLHLWVIRNSFRQTKASIFRASFNVFV